MHLFIETLWFAASVFVVACVLSLVFVICVTAYQQMHKEKNDADR